MTERPGAAGKAARVSVPRGSHAAWRPAPDRRGPVQILESQALTRVSELVPIRYGRMLSSPFAFFRGAAAVMAADLAASPTSGLYVQLCGDAHLANFGMLRGPGSPSRVRPERLRRDAAGPVGMGRQATRGQRRGCRPANAFSASERGHAVRRASAPTARRCAIRRDATIDVWYARLEVEDCSQQFSAMASRHSASGSTRRSRRRARRTTSARSPRSTQPRRRHAADRQRPAADRSARRPAARPRAADARRMRAAADPAGLPRARSGTIGAPLLDRYRSSTGTQGRRRRQCRHPLPGSSLLLGRDDDDPLFLQIKEAGPLGARAVRGAEHVREPRRTGRRGTAADAGRQRHLPRLAARRRRSTARPRLLRPAAPGLKGSVATDDAAAARSRPYAGVCGSTLARAHARSGDRDRDRRLPRHDDRFDRALAAFAETYADQNERDYQSLAEAVRDGSVLAETDSR